MRFRSARKFLCGVTLTVSLGLTVLLMKATDLQPRNTPNLIHDFSSGGDDLIRKSTRDEHLPVPPNPPPGDIPDYPLPDVLQALRPGENLDSGESVHERNRLSEGSRRKVGAPNLQQGKDGEKDDMDKMIFRSVEEIDENSQQPEPDLYKQGKVGLMLIEAKKKHGDWHPYGHRNKGVVLFHEEQAIERPKSAAAGKLQEADALWNLLQPATRKPVHDSVQQIANSHCIPKHHVFFGKVHKTGSSTVANILQRYGFTRTLNFVLPRKRIHSRSYNYITMPGQQVSPERLIPPPVGEHYDILWNHAVYDSDFYHRVMPADTVFVSILRQPLQQFQSAFEYYGHIPGSYLHDILSVNVSNPLSLYLHSPGVLESSTSYLSYIRNKQAQDLGMKMIHVLNATQRAQYIQRLGKEFSLVMITEFFDESLVLMRRLLCWTVRDVLYMPKNRNVYKKKRTFSEEDKALHRKLNVADYDLYEFFLKRFNDTVAQQGPDFHEEVAYFKKLLTMVQKHCSQPNSKAVMRVSESRWSEAFNVTPEDCKLMGKHELLFLDDIMADAVRRYQKSAINNMQS